MKRLLTGAALALMIPGAAWAVPAIMPVYGVRADSDGVTVRLPPQGPGHCAPRRGPLTMAVDKGAAGVTLLVALSGNAECRAPGPGGEVHWSYRELGMEPGQPFRFANPIVADPGNAL